MLKDLRPDLASLWRRLSSRGRGTIMFVAARPGEGTSSVASSFAMLASRASEKPVWIIDLDLENNPLYSVLERGQGGALGRPVRAYDASLRAADTMYRLTPGAGEGGADKLLTVYDVAETELFVTRLRSEYLADGQSVAPRQNSSWWQALRGVVDWAIVDAPALNQSGAALRVARQMDGIILVVQADRTSAADVNLAQKRIADSGGKLLGVVMNQVAKDALRQAGASTR